MNMRSHINNILYLYVWFEFLRDVETSNWILMLLFIVHRIRYEVDIYFIFTCLIFAICVVFEINET